MNVLSACRLGKYFGERALFTDVSFEVDARDKIGLVGRNGCGKTTLFRLLTGEYTPDEGEVVKSRETVIGYMEQHVGRAGGTLYETVESVFAPLIAQERELAVLTAELEHDPTPEKIERHHRLNEAFADAGGLYYKSRVRSALLGLGFAEEDLSRPLSTFSGGQQSKAAMARLLLSGSNLLLLDEPTNHLDIAAVEWLEEYLRGYAGAVLIVSHDRYFLDRVTNRTLELDRGRLYASGGNYSAHREWREREEEIAEKHYKHAMQEIEKLEGNIALLKQWNREKSVRQAESREKRLARMKEQLEVPVGQESALSFRFTAAETGGNEVLTGTELSMGFGGAPLFSGADIALRRGERVFLLGPNGCGKTTLLKILSGRLTPLRGMVREGAWVSIGYYDQTQAGLCDEKSVFDELHDAYPTMTQTELRCALAAFLFTGDEVFRPVGQLSGGERARVLLLKLMLKRDNLLLLDEPTNHLDIASREALEDALLGYDGTLLIVSHDRYFINRLATRTVRLTGTGCVSIPGDYDAYAAQFREPEREKTEEKPAPKQNDYKRRKEQESENRKLLTRLRRCEETVAALEEKSAALTAELMGDAAADHLRATELSAQLDGVQQELFAQMTLWEQLQTQAEEAGLV